MAGNILPTIQCYVARGGVSNEKSLLILITYELCIYKDMHYIANSLCKITLERQPIIIIIISSSSSSN